MADVLPAAQAHAPLEPVEMVMEPEEMAMEGMAAYCAQPMTQSYPAHSFPAQSYPTHSYPLTPTGYHHPMPPEPMHR